jgi:hypothetical protein
MSTPTDQRKQVRIVAQSNKSAGVVKTVNIVTVKPSIPSEVKECVQVTAANWALGARGVIATFMDGSASPKGLPTIFISGYTAPN